MCAIRVGIFADDYDFFRVRIGAYTTYRSDKGSKVGVFLYNDLTLMVGLTKNVDGHENVAKVIGEVGVLNQGVAWTDNTFEAR